MPVKEDLLEILCCPESKKPLKVLSADAIARINERIAAGQVKYASGGQVKDPLEEALVTLDGARLYAVRDSIPVMLVDESILTDQLGDEIRAQLPSEAS